MKTLKLTCIILLLAVAGYAQVITQSQISHLKAQGWQPNTEFVTLQQNRQLVADETELIMLKASFRIETSNDVILSKLLAKFKPIIKKYSVEFKADRKGEYKLYSVPFKNEELSNVKAFFKTL